MFGLTTGYSFATRNKKTKTKQINIKKMKAKFLSMLAVAALIFTSCSSDDDSGTPPAPTNENLAGNLTEDLHWTLL